MANGGHGTGANGGGAVLAMTAFPPGGARESTAHPRSRSRDAEGFERIVRRHERRVYGVARRLLGRAEDAEDAAQEAFLRLYRALDRLDPTRPVLPYLYRLTVNVCRDMGRRRRLREVSSLTEVPPDREPVDRGVDPARAARLAEERRIASDALATLPEKQRAALVLRDLQGLSTREVAEVLGTSEVTVRTQISRARLKVKEYRDRILGKEEG